MRKKKDRAGMMTVPVARRRRKCEVSWGRASAMVAKKNALRPNAARGNAVAVPRWSGKLRAADLMAAVNAEQLPAPVKKEKRQREVML